MRPNLLILGGTRNASDLALHVAKSGVDAVLSYAGAVSNPREQPIPTRIGGFGGADGLAAHLLDFEVSHIVDATHPFAAQMSRNAVAAATRAAVPLIALTRPPWEPQPGDEWLRTPDMATAVQALAIPPKRVFLAIGRTDVARFTEQPQHHYLLRLVDAPSAAPPLPNHEIVLDRGPFDIASDRALLESHGIELVVSKNSGGDGARAKLDAARELGLPVLMIDRPELPPRREVETVEQVMSWITHGDTERGV